MFGEFWPVSQFVICVGSFVGGGMWVSDGKSMYFNLVISSLVGNGVVFVARWLF